jgi:ribosomal protein S18 acetylase RimI-like enzyme
MRVTIRKARRSDRSAVAALFKEMFDFHGQRDAHFTRTESGHEVFGDWFIDQIGQESSMPLVAEVDGEVAGYALGILRKHPQVFLHRDYGEVNDIAVGAKFRRQGTGQALFARMSEWFTSHGITRIEARVATSNEVSSGFWRRLGFTPYLETLVLKTGAGAARHAKDT